MKSNNWEKDVRNPHLLKWLCSMKCFTYECQAILRLWLKSMSKSQQNGEGYISKPPTSIHMLSRQLSCAWLAKPPGDVTFVVVFCGLFGDNTRCQVRCFEGSPKSGPSPGFSSRGGKKTEGAKNQKWGHILKIQYWMYVATKGPNVKWGGIDFKWGFGNRWPPAGDVPGANALAFVQKFFKLLKWAAANELPAQMLPESFEKVW